MGPRRRGRLDLLCVSFVRAREIPDRLPKLSFPEKQKHRPLVPLLFLDPPSIVCYKNLLSRQIFVSLVIFVSSFFRRPFPRCFFSVPPEWPQYHSLVSFIRLESPNSSIKKSAWEQPHPFEGRSHGEGRRETKNNNSRSLSFQGEEW